MGTQIEVLSGIQNEEVLGRIDIWTFAVGVDLLQ
jgi:hypothetical protein